MASTPLLRAQELVKSFGAIRAVDHVSIEVYPGEVLGLVGENGAGKSTLIAMLAGLHAPDEGQIVIDGEARPALSPGLARQLGVSVVYQELALCPNLTVADNVFLGQPSSRFGLLQRSRMRVETRRVLRELGSVVSPTARVEQLRMADRQLIEIGRALLGRVRVLILDEPTSSLSHEDFEVLEGIIRKFQRSGVGVVFVSHRLSEVIELADRVMVMRDGRTVTTVPSVKTSVDALAALMVGGRATAEALPPARGDQLRKRVLEVRGLTAVGKFTDVSLHVSEGEIVGIAGLRGAGRHELADAIFGLAAVDRGEIVVRGRLTRHMTPQRAKRLGMAYLPQDRRGGGIVAVWDLKHNVALGNLDGRTRLGVIRDGRLAVWARNALQRFRVRPPEPERGILTLSGGNQQKVVLARALADAPEVLIALEATRGVDVGAKAEIRQLLRHAAKGGTAVLLVDSELTDMLALCDRIYVMHRGRLAGDLLRSEATEEAITFLAAGGGDPEASRVRTQPATASG